MFPHRSKPHTAEHRTPVDSTGLTRRALRRVLRTRRRGLSSRKRRVHAGAVRDLLLPSPLLRGVRNLGAYLAADGEIDPLALLTGLGDRGIRPWLPCIAPIPRGPNRLRFRRLQSPQAMRPNRFGIPEPFGTRMRAGWTLDAVLIPLVGFDRTGARLGMGAGYYDATFDARRDRPNRPALIGLAHSLQEVTMLDQLPHDAPLDAIVTEQEVILPTGH
mgnify:CR=1 FL=1